MRHICKGVTMRKKVFFTVAIDAPITEEDRKGLTKAIEAVVGLLIAPDSYMVESRVQ
jgi:hypothetical protein